MKSSLYFLIIFYGLGLAQDCLPKQLDEIIEVFSQPGKTEAHLLKRFHPLKSQYSSQLEFQEALNIKQQQYLALGMFGAVDVKYQCGNPTRVLWSLTDLPPVLPIPSLQNTDQNGWAGGISLASMNFLGKLWRNEIRFLSIFNDPLKSGEFFFHSSIPEESPYSWGTRATLMLTHGWQASRQYEEKSFYQIVEPFVKLPWLNLGFMQRYLWQNSKNQNGLLLNKTQMLGLGSFITTGSKYAGGCYCKIHNYFELRYSLNPWQEGLFHEQVIDNRIWIPLGNPRLVAHNFSLFQLRQGRVPEPYFLMLGGVNSLRGYTSDPQFKFRQEWIIGGEVRYQIYPPRSTTIPILGKILLGLETVIGVESALVGSQLFYSKTARRYSANYLGLHVLLPGFERLRIEIGAPTKSLSFKLETGFFQKSVAQRWKKR